MTTTRKVRVYTYDPVLFDRMRGVRLEAGARVVKTQPFGTPPNGTMGMCYVNEADSGKFVGLVMLNSLKATKETVTPRDLAAEARDRRSAALYGGSRNDLRSRRGTHA